MKLFFFSWYDAKNYFLMEINKLGGLIVLYDENKNVLKFKKKLLKEFFNFCSFRRKYMFLDIKSGENLF